MSYILEAIKKADQKRKLGSVPDVNSEHGSSFSDEKKARWPYLVAAALFINAGLIGWWLLPGEEESASVDIAQVEQSEEVEEMPVNEVIGGGEKTVDQTVVLDETESQITNEQVGTVAEKKSGPTIPLSAESKLSAEDVKELQPEEGVAAAVPAQVVASNLLSPEKSIPVKSDAVEEEILPKKVDIAVASGSAVESPPETITGDTLAELKKDTDRQQDKKPKERIEQLDSDEHEPVVVGRVGGSEALGSATEDDLVEEYMLEKEKEDEKKDLEKIPYFYQLPDSVKKTLPEIHISFHVFARRPSARIVSVNGKVLREGQNLEKKVKLEQITPFGIVLLSDTWRYKVEID